MIACGSTVACTSPTVYLCSMTPETISEVKDFPINSCTQCLAHLAQGTRRLKTLDIQQHVLKINIRLLTRLPMLSEKNTGCHYMFSYVHALIWI
jgi:hypothetical protein